MPTVATLKSSNDSNNYYFVEGEIGAFWVLTYSDKDYIHIETERGKRVPAEQRREILPIIQSAIHAGAEPI